MQVLAEISTSRPQTDGGDESSRISMKRRQSTAALTSSMGISLPKVQLTVLCISTLLYAVFFTLVLITTAVMSYMIPDDIRSQRVKILLVSYAMLVVATLHFVVCWVRGVYGFADRKGGSATAFYADISDPTYLLRLCLLRLQSVLGDGLIIWRLCIVYDRRSAVIIPAILLVTTYEVVGLVIIGIIAGAPIGTDILHVATSWITAYFSLTMATNVILSGAIILRILLAGNPLRGPSPHWRIIFVIVESCALYTVFSVVTALAAFASKSNGQYTAVDSIVPMIGIAFSLVVLQICFHDNAPHDPRNDGPTSSTAWYRTDDRPFGVEEPMPLIRVHVSRQIDTDLNPHDVVKDGSNSFDSLDTDKPTLV